MKIADATSGNKRVSSNQWTPAFAGVTLAVIPAQAGIQVFFIRTGGPKAHDLCAFRPCGETAARERMEDSHDETQG
jgi:hypothetical protein